VHPLPPTYLRHKRPHFPICPWKVVACDFPAIEALSSVFTFSVYSMPASGHLAQQQNQRRFPQPPLLVKMSPLPLLLAESKRLCLHPGSGKTAPGWFKRALS
jgi:hypothetical protein